MYILNAQTLSNGQKLSDHIMGIGELLIPILLLLNFINCWWCQKIKIWI